MTDQRDTAVLQPRNLPGIIQATDDLVAARQDRVHIELAGDRLRGAGNPAGLSQRLGRAQQRLGRHAGVVRALTPPSSDSTMATS